MWIDTKHRSNAPEIMDNFNMEGEVLRDALDKIAAINHFLGGNKVTISGVEQLIGNVSHQKTIRIIDIGCGNGDMLRTLSKYGKRKNLNFQLIGIDANDFTIAYAKKLSADYENITYQCRNIFDGELEQCDIVLCTLTLHHFEDQEIVTLLKNTSKVAHMGIVVNDLHRSAIAYYLFKLVCLIFRLNKMSKDDGLVSILRGFKKYDLIRYCKQLQLKYCSVSWKWAFRYQWVIKNYEC